MGNNITSKLKDKESREELKIIRNYKNNNKSS